jgi:SpoVK/Ycf46/Vps4 family AAA+-type ATPase
MRTGFACLFSGGPGTGKTETALQLARRTGRTVFRVDIADTKSMWFGESEKRIKQVFTRYQRVAKNAALAPILLFNEADAVIGKRQNLDGNARGPAQTENAIQNIILEQLENLTGILIATTNLAANMDSAFERRFLYKVDFEKPTAETRKNIWRSQLKQLSGEDAAALAARFEFSGGQIENIARKAAVFRILHGEAPPLAQLIAYCKDEATAGNNAKPIGFSCS